MAATSTAILPSNDALNKIVYEAHIYFDHDNSGTYRGTYDQEGVNADDRR